VIPQCGEPKLGYGSGDSRRWYGQRILVRIILGRLGGTCFELFSGGLIIGVDKGTPARIERFGEFKILRMWVSKGSTWMGKDGENANTADELRQSILNREWVEERPLNRIYHIPFSDQKATGLRELSHNPERECSINCSDPACVDDRRVRVRGKQGQRMGRT